MPYVLGDKSHGYKSIFSFDEADGDGPQGPLLYQNGQFYGTTSGGGNWSAFSGTFFALSASGEERVLHSFGRGGDGRIPVGNLVASDGVFYGVTSNGGKYGDGVVFSVTESGSEKVLHDFGGGTDGQTPVSGLTMYKGLLYGTTSAGGKDAGGTVFSITTSGKERILHSFYNSRSEDGTMPEGGLTVLNGLLYGTTATGGCDVKGTVFSMTTSGRVKVLYRFGCNLSKADGSLPDQTLVAEKNILYGTTYFGYGPNSNFYGTVFSLTPSGKERLLYEFVSPSDGVYPEGQLLPVNGTFYGVTYHGGAGYGTVFSVTKSGKESVLHSFGPHPDGEYPESGLINVNGTLYGTTAAGGAHAYGGAGTVFRISP